MGQCNAGGLPCPRRRRKRIILLLVGLDNAGKTCAAKCLLRESRENVAPTVGFSIVKPKSTKHDVTIYDLGGGQRIRGIWKCYLAEAHGVIYVVDASDPERFAECKEALHELIGNSNVSGKPLLLLANKQDNENALDEIDVCEALDIESIVNKFKCRTKVETCSATAYQGKRFDESILKGYQWLVNTVAADYASLSGRVDRDMQKQREIQEKEQAERAERIRLLREQRDKLEGAVDDLSEGSELVNPFRPINEITDNLDQAARQENGSREIGGDGSVSVNTDPSNDSELHPPLVNGFMVTNSTSSEGHNNEAAVMKTKKKRRLGRHNKTAPMDVPTKDNAALPPLQLRSGGSHTTVTISTPITDALARPSSGVKHSWGLAEELEPVESDRNESSG